MIWHHFGSFLFANEHLLKHLDLHNRSISDRPRPEQRQVAVLEYMFQLQMFMVELCELDNIRWEVTGSELRGVIVDADADADVYQMGEGRHSCPPPYVSASAAKQSPPASFQQKLESIRTLDLCRVP